LVQDSCQSKHKKRKRHTRNDDCGHANWNSDPDLAESATYDAELSTALVSIDHSRDCNIKVKKKKRKSHSHIDGLSVEDMLRRVTNDDCDHADWNSDPDLAEPATCDAELSTALVSIDHSQDCSKVKKKKKLKSHIHIVEDTLSSDIGSRKKEAVIESRLNSSLNLNTLTAAQNTVVSDTHHRPAVTSEPLEVEQTDRVANNPEHLVQPEAVFDAGQLVKDSNMTASFLAAESHLNEGSIESGEQPLKLSHSAKRRSRRRRVRKSNHRKVEGDAPSDEQRKDTLTTSGISLQNVSNSNLAARTSHSLASGFVRTHIVFDDVNSHDETGIKAHPETHLTSDIHDSQIVKDQDVDCDTVAADSVVNRFSDVETVPHVQCGNNVSNGLVCSNVNKAYSATHLSAGTKVHRPVKNTQFANVQVFCRQRMKKSVSATHIPNSQAANTATSPLPIEASIMNLF